MQVSKIHRAATGLFSHLSNELVYRQEYLAPFIQNVFHKKAFEQQMKLKSDSYSEETRKILVAALQEQYSTITPGEKVNRNIDLLKEKTTFTITTGHQLSLFTGPLYFIYKILHIIKLCEELKAAYPENNFVPVFWLASEDHDFEEVNHFYLFGKKISWNTEQQGPVGMFDTFGLNEIREQLHELFSSKPESEIHQIIDQYDGKTYGEAQFKLVHSLFKEFGLIIIEPNNIRLKTVFSPVTEKELFNRFAEEKVLNATKELTEAGFKGQVFPRPINFFYIEKGFRKRIQWENDHFFIESKGNFSTEEMRELLQNHPERFSPNVIFRPVYQETILPNLCYVGGGGEIAYWLQLKGVFEEVNVPYPLIQVRNSLQLIDSGTLKKMEKLSLGFFDFIEDIDTIKKEYVQKNTSEEVNFEKISAQFDELKNLLKEQLPPVDAQLVSFTEIENNKLDKQLEAIQSKVIRIQKQKMDTSMKQLEDVKNKMFPNGNLQERTDLFLNYCPTGNIGEFLNNVYSAIEPFEKDFIVVGLTA
ncbi:MAG: bacillithiol biosynthesis cysteine-adding enzyme BshC [Flavobacteriia bacterium 40-80]|nr:MAG: bacillithiol biosynthesis cysteine-adding enzyme BshC [Flavobacteriia bacterium 40-80]